MSRNEGNISVISRGGDGILITNSSKEERSKVFYVKTSGGRYTAEPDEISIPWNHVGFKVAHPEPDAANHCVKSAYPSARVVLGN
jgi:hypothetical protein